MKKTVSIMLACVFILTLAVPALAYNYEFESGGDTLPGFDLPCATAFVDVDLRSSLETCIKAIWPLLAQGGALFVHEARHKVVSSFFYDEAWWREHLDAAPPGLVGAGSGLGLEPVAGGWISSLGYAIKPPPAE